MRILHVVESYFPSLGGMAEVVRQLSERMVRHGHNVDVFTTAVQSRPAQLNGVLIREYAISGNYVRGIVGDQAEKERYCSDLFGGNYDVVVFFAAQQWSVDLVLPRLSQLSAKKIFVPTGFSALFDPEYQEYFEKMKSWLFQFDLCIFLSDQYRDINFARECEYNKIAIIPNGADENEFKPHSPQFRKQYGISSNVFLILHVGSHTNQKGHKELFSIFRQLKEKKAVLCIIGNHVSRRCTWRCHLCAWFVNLFSSKRVLLLHVSRAMVVRAYQESDLFLFPSNVECSPIVLYEACASKTPFLATDVGNSAEIALRTGGGEILPTYKDEKGNSFARVDESARAVDKLIGDRQRRISLADAGYLAWKNKYTWEQICLLYEDEYAGVLKNE